MKNKIEKLVKACIGKFKLLAVVTAVVVAIGVVCLALFGFSVNTTNDDVTALTVGVNQYAYSQHIDELEDVAENFFSENGVDYQYSMRSEMLGDESEIVYVFKSDVTFTAEKVNALQEKYDALTVADSNSPLAGSSVKVSATAEKTLGRLPMNALIRAVVAAVAFAVLASLYLAIRHHYASGATMLVALGVSAALTCALVLASRMPITGNFLYVFFFNLLFTAVCTMFTLNNALKAQKEDKKIDAETLVNSSVAVWQVLTFAGATAVALVLLGAIATSAVRWTAAIALLSVVAGVFASLFVAPTIYLIVKKFADAKDAQRARYDYKKS